MLRFIAFQSHNVRDASKIGFNFFLLSCTNCGLNFYGTLKKFHFFFFSSCSTDESHQKINDSSGLQLAMAIVVVKITSYEICVIRMYHIIRFDDDQIKQFQL